MGLKEIVEVALLSPISGTVVNPEWHDGFVAAAEIALNHVNQDQQNYWFELMEYNSGCSPDAAEDAAQDGSIKASNYCWTILLRCQYVCK